MSRASQKPAEASARAPKAGLAAESPSEGGVDLQQLVLKSESVVDDVLRQQLKEVQRQQEKIFQDLLNVQRLLDYLPLLQLQQKEEIRARRRERRVLRGLKLFAGEVTSSSDSEPEESRLSASNAEGAEAGEAETKPSSRGEAREGAQETRRPSGSEKKECEEPVSVDALVNIGCNTYLRARGDDVGKLLIKVGFEFYLEMSLEEATEFLTKKEALLIIKYEYWSGKCADIKAQIQMLLQAIAAVVEEPALQAFPFA
ncbi:hypothetical protein BESB_065850 [Besnoitia besnoiti]|uniref:Prefoldin subunit n=1 Tax=Besnoitia besnoiti TaxID=94643 RepID=A0A2A9MGM8_BESBE|nr:hypothetical protein BESB_065850 [Besnoitia besnoiti]PFH34552.1 hypothetical protein BESB_065850 [Besnoitia besnoiti]